MFYRTGQIVAVCLCAALGLVRTGETAEAGSSVEVTSVVVAGKPVPFSPNREASLGALPTQIEFHFGPSPGLGRLPIRLRCRLTGYETDWHSGGGEMYLAVRFYNDAGDQIAHQTFSVTGESAGWTGSVRTSALTHRRETVVTPTNASQIMVVVSSAGAPATEGIYAVANLSVSRIGQAAGAVDTLMLPFQGQAAGDDSLRPPVDWVRDGLSLSMAKIISVGREPAIPALAILDNDPLGHAEWRNTLGVAPRVNPGDKLLVEWNEMYSIGLEENREMVYPHLEPGSYTFEVQEVNIYGQPTGVATRLSVVVSPPMWRTTWFWSVIFLFSVGLIYGFSRYAVRQKMRQEMQVLKNQQALERERLRIAHDIHDDLGARVTQISLLSGLAQGNAAFPTAARTEFDQITRMSRELVLALYETVWAVNPENDNLYSLGNYLCQMVNQLCGSSQIRCRIHLDDLPRAVLATSQIRHNITMVVKEAVHNVIKHAGATEISIRATFADDLLTVSVHDDGRGFSLSGGPAGHGLKNMKKRMEDIGGTCEIASLDGQGTTMILQLKFK